MSCSGRTLGAEYGQRGSKRLYDKEHPRRDRQTRMEDLLRWFLDVYMVYRISLFNHPPTMSHTVSKGRTIPYLLLDEKVRFHAEYVKEPQSLH